MKITVNDKIEIAGKKGDFVVIIRDYPDPTNSMTKDISTISIREKHYFPKLSQCFRKALDYDLSEKERIYLDDAVRAIKNQNGLFKRFDQFNNTSIFEDV